MKVFVTGGTGFIGKHFIRHCLLAGDEVAALRRNPVPANAVNPVEWIDFPLDAVPVEALTSCKALVHLAAHGASDPQNATWRDCFHWNVTAAIDLWEKAYTAGVRRFVICGSCFEYGKSGEKFEFIPVDAPLEPTGPYHSSKAAATMAALGFAVQKSVELLILRPFHVYGAGEAPNRFWPSLREAAISGADFPMTDGRQIRDFVKVEEVASRFHHALSRKDLKQGEPIIENIGSGNPRSLLEFATNEWNDFGATGRLLPGLKPQRANETMRYVPSLPKAPTV